MEYFQAVHHYYTSTWGSTHAHWGLWIKAMLPPNHLGLTTNSPIEALFRLLKRLLRDRGWYDMGLVIDKLLGFGGDSTDAVHSREFCITSTLIRLVQLILNGDEKRPVRHFDRVSLSVREMQSKFTCLDKLCANEYLNDYALNMGLLVVHYETPCTPARARSATNNAGYDKLLTLLASSSTSYTSERERSAHESLVDMLNSCKRNTDYLPQIVHLPSKSCTCMRGSGCIHISSALARCRSLAHSKRIFTRFPCYDGSFGRALYRNLIPPSTLRGYAVTPVRAKDSGERAGVLPVLFSRELLLQVVQPPNLLVMNSEAICAPAPHRKRKKEHPHPTFHAVQDSTHTAPFLNSSTSSSAPAPFGGGRVAHAEESKPSSADFDEEEDVTDFLALAAASTGDPDNLEQIEADAHALVALHFTNSQAAIETRLPSEH